MNQREIEDELSPKDRFDCQKLHDLLKASHWIAADKETQRLIFQATGREKEKRLRVEDIQKLPCTTLQIIDQLWVEHSKGRFGFSIQRKIYLECGGDLSGSSPSGAWHKFGHQVGWAKEGSEGLYFHYDYTINTHTPLGHLPCQIFQWSGSWFYTMFGGGLNGNGHGAIAFFSRIEGCKL